MRFSRQVMLSIARKCVEGAVPVAVAQAGAVLELCQALIRNQDYDIFAPGSPSLDSLHCNRISLLRFFLSQNSAVCCRCWRSRAWTRTCSTGPGCCVRSSPTSTRTT